MRVFALSDPHLGTNVDKPMDRFGPHWQGHPARIERHWRERVRADDLVLVPGDISWAMRLDAALDDLRFLGALPGTKVILRGNHDYWWQAVGKVRRALPPGMLALQNDALRIGDVAVCGTRGWTLPGGFGYVEAEDAPYVRREVERLELSVRALPAGVRHRIAIFHYPPIPADGGPSGFAAVLEAAAVPLCVYGHLHRGGAEPADRPVEGTFRGVRYVNASCDFIDFTPILVLEA